MGCMHKEVICGPLGFSPRGPSARGTCLPLRGGPVATCSWHPSASVPCTSGLHPIMQNPETGRPGTLDMGGWQFAENCRSHLLHRDRRAWGCSGLGC